LAQALVAGCAGGLCQLAANSHAAAEAEFHGFGWRRAVGSANVTRAANSAFKFWRTGRHGAATPASALEASEPNHAFEAEQSSEISASQDADPSSVLERHRAQLTGGGGRAWLSKHAGFSYPDACLSSFALFLASPI